jgi:hypothetical protein
MCVSLSFVMSVWLCHYWWWHLDRLIWSEPTGSMAVWAVWTWWYIVQATICCWCWILKVIYHHSSLQWDSALCARAPFVLSLSEFRWNPLCICYTIVQPHLLSNKEKFELEEILNFESANGCPWGSSCRSLYCGPRGKGYGAFTGNQAFFIHVDHLLEPLLLASASPRKLLPSLHLHMPSKSVRAVQACKILW